MAARAHVEPGPDHLAEALRRLRRPGGPTTLPDAITHPIYGPCVRGLAHRLANAAPTRFDAKRAAANDLDD